MLFPVSREKIALKHAFLFYRIMKLSFFLLVKTLLRSLRISLTRKTNKQANIKTILPMNSATLLTD